MEEIEDQFVMTTTPSNIIKVVGVGGGGSNAVNHMYKQNIKDVSFVVCNTDDQALRESSVPTKVKLGENTTHGLGAGNIPSKARKAAEESRKNIEKMLNDGTKMVFITAGMGGGTGTGAAPVVASIAKSMHILTIGIVTIPFAFEGKKKIYQALTGVAAMSEHVDALLVINNDKLRTIYPNLELSNAFDLADDVLTHAAKGIAEIITIHGHINVDFADVATVMHDGGVAIMNSGVGEGENRITQAIDDALNSPLLNNNDIHKSKKILLNFYCSKDKPIMMSEVDEIDNFMSNMGEDIEVIWGITFDEDLKEQVKVTLLATGSGMKVVPEEFMKDYLEEKQRIEELKTNESEGNDNEDEVIEIDKLHPNDAPDTLKNWAGTIYKGINDKTQTKITVENVDFQEIYDDDEELERLQKEPAYLRKNK